jgi:alpha-D-ribose 1-methylphosphonate 5-triphosphate diphosphatase
VAPAGSLLGSGVGVRGLLVLPGIVDVHGDGFEKVIAPRSGARFPTRLALQTANAHLLAAGITTAYFALSCTWEPGLRSLAGASEFVATFRLPR